jgi:hypothetical protein
MYLFNLYILVLEGILDGVEEISKIRGKNEENNSSNQASITTKTPTTTKAKSPQKSGPKM